MARLGCGLIGIGKRWGYAPGEVPGEKEALRFLESAWELGIRFFDTAASYGTSEQRLGRFLKSLSGAERATLTVATKFGEHWNEGTGEPYVDHSFSALCRSLDRSLERLGAIDILQLHKTTPPVLRSDDLARAWEYARSAGIPCPGASVSDMESARITVSAGCYRVIQFPFHRDNTVFEEVFGLARAGGLEVLVNRPFDMGRLFYVEDGTDARAKAARAFSFLLARPFDGVILSGTKSVAHLREHWMAFQDAA